MIGNNAVFTEQKNNWWNKFLLGFTPTEPKFYKTKVRIWQNSES